jgi:ABC-2 type transport system permease protein
MSAFIHHLAFEFRSGIRNRSLLLLNYLFPLGFYLLMGALMGRINPLYPPTMIPSMVTFAIVTATLLGLPDPLVTAREAGILRSFKINGVPAASIVLIPAITTALHAALVSLAICVTAPRLFSAALPTNWVGFGVCFLAASLALSGVAVLIGVISPSTRVTVLWSQLIFLPSMMLGGITGVPADLLPEGLQRLSLLLPPTWAMRALNGWPMGAPAARSLTAAAILAAGGVLAFALAIYLFSWDRHSGTRRGNPLLALLALAPYLVGAVMGG